MIGETARAERVQPAAVRAALAALEGQPLRDLLLFRRLKKWTVPCFADYWGTSADTARRRGGSAPPAGASRTSIS